MAGAPYQIAAFGEHFSVGLDSSPGGYETRHFADERSGGAMLSLVYFPLIESSASATVL